MLFNDDNKKQSSQPPMSNREFGAAMIAIFTGIGALGFWKNQNAIEAWYVYNFEKVWVSVFLLIATIICTITYFVSRRSKNVVSRVRELEKVARHTEESVFAGLTTDGGKVFVPNASRTGHVQIIGSTGRGKTHGVITPWIMRDLANGKDVVVIDGKGSSDIESELKNLKKNVNKYVFDMMTPERSIHINPLKSGSVTEITDRLFTAFEFKESEYYRNLQYDTTLMLVALIKGNNEAVTFKRLYELLTNDEALIGLANVDANKAHERRVQDYLKVPESKRRETHSGLISQLVPFATGELAEILNGDWYEPFKEDISVSISDLLLGIYESSMFLPVYNQDYSTVMIFNLPTMKYPVLAAKVGKMIFQEMAWAISEREKTKRKEFTPLFMDEFSSFVYEGFINILNKARSSGVALHLSHQSMGDLSQVSDDFAKSLNTNTNIKCILGLNDPDTADFFARHIGTRTQKKMTEKMQRKGFFNDFEEMGHASVRETESYKVHPNTLKSLGIGAGVLHLQQADGNSFSEVVQFVPFCRSELAKKEETTSIWEVVIGY